MARPTGRIAHLKQSDVYGLITSLSEPNRIDLAITLKNFGFIEKPFLAYYGQTSALEISEWWKKHGTAICTRNIRQLLPKSAVNEAMRQTLLGQPDNFWYFNNGVTIICDSLQKTLTGAPARDIGLFNCKGVSVVNGAQTVGIIGSGFVGSETNTPWVQIRIISLETAPTDFDRLITQATNFQNAVSARDFVSMDAHQQRIAMDFSLDKRRYVYKSGDDEPQGSAGCTVTEATQALSCAISMEMAVLVKRNLSELWADVTLPPYTTLFNDNVTSEIVWKAVQIMRTVDAELQNLRSQEHPMADFVGVHLNYALLHLVFRDPKIRDFQKRWSKRGEIAGGC
ncbi:MAG TPA: AIPR family protein [Rhizomicrobium sp.]|nr:AIPR family protein [Rhizomicrobium sp.]